MSGNLFADIVTSAKLFGLGVGDDVSIFDSQLRFDHYEQSYGRGESRMLRRDYGLFEATFVGAPDWRCSNLIVEVHRLASMATLVDEVRRLEGLALPRYVVWRDIQQAVNQAGRVSRFVALESVGSDARFGIVEPGVVVDVVDDGSTRSDQPGSGDVWSIALTGVSKAAR